MSVEHPSRCLEIACPARRPAVFLFNHRNNFDIFIVAALVKDNWTGIAKKELASNPLVGPLGVRGPDH